MTSGPKPGAKAGSCEMNGNGHGEILRCAQDDKERQPPTAGQDRPWHTTIRCKLTPFMLLLDAGRAAD